MQSKNLHRKKTVPLATTGKSSVNAVNEPRNATCPTCHCRGVFDYLGEQHWPADIAQKFNLPTVIVLWSCPCCHTTVSEPELLPARVGTPCPTDKTS